MLSIVKISFDIDTMSYFVIVGAGKPGENVKGSNQSPYEFPGALNTTQNTEGILLNAYPHM